MITAIGLMSGTSGDGIDSSIIESDGENSFNPILITKSELYKNNETTHERLMRDYVTAKLY